MTALTPRRRRILSAVNTYAWLLRRSPSHSEIGSAVGSSSVGTVGYHLGALVDGGWLAAAPGRSGTLRLGPRAAGSKGGVVAEVVPVVGCDVCGLTAPADHKCGDTALADVIYLPADSSAERRPPLHVVPLAIKESS